MDARETARFVGQQAAHAARETRAFRRGNVAGSTEAGQPIILLPNGGKIVAQQSLLFGTSPNQSVHLLRQGNGLEVFAPSPYGGGLGAPFVTP